MLGQEATVAVPPSSKMQANELQPTPDHPALDVDPITQAFNPVTLDVQSRSSLPSNTPPDGGKDAWMSVLGCFFLLFASFGFITSFGQLQAYYLEHQLQGYSKATIAWIGSSQLFITYATALPFGRWYDLHGMRALTTGAAILMTTSLIGVAFSTSYFHFLLAHLAYGLGCGCIFSPSIAIPGQWFLRRRGTAMGLIVSGTGIGGIIYPIMFVKLFERLSFRDSLLIVAGLNLVILVPTIFIVKVRSIPSKSPPWSSALQPFEQKEYVFLVSGIALGAMNMFTPFLYAPLLASSHHLPTHISSYAVAILQSGSISGRLSAGPMADRIGVFPTFTIGGIGMSTVLFTLWTTDLGGVGVTIFGLWAFGHTNGMWLTMLGGCCAAVTEKGGKMHELGMRTGLMFTLNAVPMLIGPVISGVIVSATHDGSYTFAAVFNGLTLLLGTSIAAAPWILRKVTSYRNRSSL